MKALAEFYWRKLFSIQAVDGEVGGSATDDCRLARGRFGWQGNEMALSEMFTMRRMGKLPVILAAALTLVTFGIRNSPVRAVELLTNGNMEIVNIPPGWSLSETVTDLPGASVNSAELVNFANLPSSAAGQTGIFLKAFAGNLNPLYLNQNKKINVVLSQTVPGVAGESYTFTGYSKWESNYSGAVDTLDVTSPSGEVPSPTESTFELAFLDASNAVLGTPVTFDLRTPVAMGGQIGDNQPRQHTLMGTAPAGSVNVRVTAAATDMVINIDPGQAGFYDNFSLKAASAPATEKLTNAGLNQPATTPGWTIVKSPANSTGGEFNTEGFANNSTGGLGGFWLRSFIGGDAKILQTVPATAGAEYEFSAWARLQPGYIGLVPASATQTFMTMEFLDGSSAVIGAPVTFDLRNATWETGIEDQGVWQQLSVNGTAPANTASVRISAGATGMADSGATMPQSAFFDDLSLMLAAAGVPGDYNENNIVDAADYTVWRDNLGADISLPNEGTDITSGIVTQEDYDFWKMSFGNGGAGSGAGFAATVPEPSSMVLVGIAVALAGAARRRGRYCERLD